MYDTCKAFLNTSNTGRLETVLSDYQERADTKTHEVWQSGRLENLRVRGSGKGITIEGSLPAYKWGSNAFSLTRQATEEVIEELSDRLHLPIALAQIWRFDLANNFTMKRPAIDYLACFMAAPHYKRFDFADRATVNFKNGLRELSFYDKARELESKRKPIPDIFKGKNILRFESRLLKRIGKQFNRRSVYAKDLSDEIFYMRAINDYWKEPYFLINKIRKEMALNMKGQREYLKSVAFYGLQNIGVDTAMDLIKSAHLRGEIGDKTAQRLRKLTLEITQAEKGQDKKPDDCIDELDAKVRQAAAFYR